MRLRFLTIRHTVTNTNNKLDQLSFKTALVTLVAIMVMVSITIVVALFFNQMRKSQIITLYETETVQFVEQRQEGVQQFFTSTFSECEKELQDKQNSQINSYVPYDVMCIAAQNMLASLGVSSLKDSSAIAYVVYDNGTYQLIEASGKYNKRESVVNPMNYGHFSYELEKRTELNEYLANAAAMDRWQDFIMYIPGKEVVVPIVIEGQTVGYFFRGVIER